MDLLCCSFNFLFNYFNWDFDLFRNTYYNMLRFSFKYKKNIFERERIEQDILVNDSTIQTLSLLTVDKK